MHLGATARAAATPNSAYGWPVKPFDRQHPVRANFGDPRTIFAGPPNQRTLLAGAGSFQFHFGIDISAPDGTAVYPVVSGRVALAKGDWLAVDAGNGHTFGYWHVAPAVGVGTQVQADVTVLGRIVKGAGHVHLTERDNGRPVNPLAPGHLEPYSDHTKPRVDAVYFRRSVRTGDLMPDFLHGRVELIASAYDLPQLRVPGAWRDLPVTPALLTWRIEQATTRRVVVPEQIAYDVRGAMPSNNLFWRIYARGTHQNMSVFGRHFSYMQPGRYLFRLAPGGFDTRTLRDGVYDLIVTATDIRGNSSSLVARFSVHNMPGVVGP
jgi:murein DD-endopeptidase MepM/ murein hydrolase activator NlpD